MMDISKVKEALSCLEDGCRHLKAGLEENPRKSSPRPAKDDLIVSPGCVVRRRDLPDKYIVSSFRVGSENYGILVSLGNGNRWDEPRNVQVDAFVAFPLRLLVGYGDVTNWEIVSR